MSGFPRPDWHNNPGPDGGDIDARGGVTLVRVGDRARGGGTVLFQDRYGYRTFSQGGVRTLYSVLGAMACVLS